MGKSSGSAFIFLILLPLFMAGAFISGCSSLRVDSKAPVIDSNMSEKEAFDGLNPGCPHEVAKRQKLVNVKYYSFDEKVHQGQLVIDAELEEDIRLVFEEALKHHFPIHSVIPISDKRFRKNDRWDDDLSMEANNTSAFNYRLVTGSSTKLSNHAFGRAIDINPFQNPYIKGNIISPKNSKYDPTAAGTLSKDNPVVQAFIRLGWEWGGNWDTRKDYQHFEKPLRKPD